MSTINCESVCWFCLYLLSIDLDIANKTVQNNWVLCLGLSRFEISNLHLQWFIKIYRATLPVLKYFPTEDHKFGEML